ncbi:hypothetical protein BDF21DRAFT_347527 [Thamnidium elegans]|nr:hypothetical protein BDF21DRAFT_347527 [Thamnidium elegans]
MFGRKSRLPTLEDLQVDSFKTYSSEQWINYLNHHIPLLHENIHINIQKSQVQQKKYFNRNRKVKRNVFVTMI